MQSIKAWPIRAGCVLAGESHAVGEVQSQAQDLLHVLMVAVWALNWPALED